jgi:hypothetical protein
MDLARNVVQLCDEFAGKWPQAPRLFPIDTKQGRPKLDVKVLGDSLDLFAGKLEIQAASDPNSPLYKSMTDVAERLRTASVRLEVLANTILLEDGRCSGGLTWRWEGVKQSFQGLEGAPSWPGAAGKTWSRGSTTCSWATSSCSCERQPRRLSADAHALRNAR